MKILRLHTSCTASQTLRMRQVCVSQHLHVWCLLNFEKHWPKIMHRMDLMHPFYFLILLAQLWYEILHNLSVNSFLWTICHLKYCLDYTALIALYKLMVASFEIYKCHQKLMYLIELYYPGCRKRKDKE
jgi:hypothetical protein